MSEGLRYLRLPTVCMVMPMFSVYNAEKDKMETVRILIHCSTYQLP